MQNAASGCRIAPHPLHLALRRATHVLADKYDIARIQSPSARLTDPERTAQVLLLPIAGNLIASVAAPTGMRTRPRRRIRRPLHPFLEK